MEDYYKLLGIHYSASLDQIKHSYLTKINDPMCDKKLIKEYKKAIFIFTNTEYKTKYDNYIQNNILKNENTKRKGNNTQSFIYNRTFSLNKSPDYNFQNTELLRPKNVGLLADSVPDFDTPIDFDSTDSINPFETPSNLSNYKKFTDGNVNKNLFQF
jgi:hypothetical protein